MEQMICVTIINRNYFRLAKGY